LHVNTKSIGELLKAGYFVLLPFEDNQRYDMVIEQKGVFKRVQCKTTRLYNRHQNVLTFPTCSSYAHRGRGSRDYRGEADFFGVFSPDTGQCYLVPVEDVGIKEARLRLVPAPEWAGSEHEIRGTVPSEVTPGLAEQPGVLATLPSRRSPVRIQVHPLVT